MDEVTGAPPAHGAVLTALADPSRRRILDLVATESQSASALARRMPISRAAVMKHVAVLERAGLLAGSRSGREVRYRVEPGPLRDTGSWLATLADTWDRRLDALRRLAEDPHPR